MIDAVRDGADAAVPGVAVTDTIKLVDADGVVVDTPPRSALVAVQTPQAFRAAVLARTRTPAVRDATDDAALVELCGGRVVVVAGEPRTERSRISTTSSGPASWRSRKADERRFESVRASTSTASATIRNGR